MVGSDEFPASLSDTAFGPQLERMLNFTGSSCAYIAAVAVKVKNGF